MKILLTISLLFMMGVQLRAQAVLPKTSVMRSVSGQFNVYDRRVPTSLRPAPRATEQTLIELAPTFLVVSCERIKQALYAELEAGRDWSGGIQVSIRSTRDRHAAAQIKVERLGAKWNYRVDLPERMAPAEFTRTLVQVLLLELANRNASERSAEIPLWLSEGLTQQLLAAREVELILPAPTTGVGTLLVTPTVLQQRDPDSLAAARQVLREHAPLALAELSWPDPEKFSPTQAEVFQKSAQLLVCELLRRDGGRESLRRWIFSLAQFYNWQTAFLRAYQGQFPNQLALEKWWALQSAYFVGRDHQQLWSPEESAQKLDTLLHTAVAIRTTAQDLPVRTDIALQTVIREWDTPRQLPALQAKLKDLGEARRRVAPAFITLVNDYATVLDDYLKKRQRWAATDGDFRSLAPSVQKVVLEAIEKLDALDAQRALIPAPISTDRTPAVRAESFAK